VLLSFFGMDLLHRAVRTGIFRIFGSALIVSSISQPPIGFIMISKRMRSGLVVPRVGQYLFPAMTVNRAEPFTLQEHHETVCNIRTVIDDQDRCCEDLFSSTVLLVCFWAGVTTDTGSGYRALFAGHGIHG